MDRCDQLRLTTSGSARAPTVHASNDGGDANIGDASTLASDCLHRQPRCHPGGAIGTACDVPETATISNPAAAIATTVRVIPFSLSFSSSANLGEHITRRHD